MGERTPECPLCGHASPRRILSAAEDRLEKRSYSECPSCLLVFVHPEYRLKPEDEKKRYDLHRNDPADERYVRFLSRVAEPLASRLPPGSQGLDYGCGPGPALSRILSRRGFQTEDYDPFYFPDESLLKRRYDFITCTETAEHFYFPGAEFQKLAGLLNPGGCLAVMTEFLQKPETFFTWYYRRDPAHVCFYRAETFLFLARRHAWEVLFPVPGVVFFLNTQKA